MGLVGAQLENLAATSAALGFFHEGPFRLRVGGVEHDILFDQSSGTVLKFTKPGRAAYAVDFDLGTPRLQAALPLDYLRRLQLQNAVFGDCVRFVGIGGSEGQRRIITRQNVAVGRAARWEEIGDLMNALQFVKLRHNHGIGYEDSHAFIRDDTVVFDMRPANVFVTEDGIVVPIDCIPVSLPSGKRAFFDK